MALTSRAEALILLTPAAVPSRSRGMSPHLNRPPLAQVRSLPTLPEKITFSNLGVSGVMLLRSPPVRPPEWLSNPPVGSLFRVTDEKREGSRASAGILGEHKLAQVSASAMT